MKQQFFKLSALCGMAFLLLTACISKGNSTAVSNNTGSNESNPASGEPKTVVGRVVDGQGKPIAGARVRAQNDVFNRFSQVFTDANGYYKLPQLEFGGWVIYAWYDAQYHDHTYHLRLAMPSPADYGSFQPSATGAITKNFVLVLKGNIPDREREEKNPFGYWGGTIHFSTYSALNYNMEYIPAGAKVTVTLTPEDGATQFDGTPGKTITRSFTVEDGETNYYLYDVPQCTYTMTASINAEGTVHSVSLGNYYLGPFKPKMTDVYFKSSGGASYENGLGVISSSAHDGPIVLKMEK